MGISRLRLTKVAVFLVASATLLPASALAASFTSVASGDWTAPGTWNVLNAIRVIGPFGVAIDPSGNIYVSKTYSHTVDKFDALGRHLSSIGGYGLANGKFYQPIGIATDAQGNLYVADQSNHRVQKFDPSGNFLMKIDTYGSGDTFNYPYNVTVDTAGNIYVVDTNNGRIQKFDASGNYLFQIGSNGSGDGELSVPQGVAIDSDGNIYVADTNNDRIEKFDSFGNYVSKFSCVYELNGNPTVCHPMTIIINSLGNLLITDGYNNHVVKFDTSGNYLAEFGQTNNGIFQLNQDGSGNIYVADPNDDQVLKFDSSGNPVYYKTICSDTHSCIAGLDYPSATDDTTISGGTTVTTPDSAFYPILNNYGTLMGNASFGSIDGNQGTVDGTAKYTFATTTTITIPNGSWWQGTATAVVNNSGGPITDWIFNGNSYNYYATLPGNAIFNDTSYNEGGTISGNATFNDTSYNDGGSTITGNASFYDSTVNNGTVQGDACFALTADNAGTVNGAVTTCDATPPTLADTTVSDPHVTSATFTSSITDTGHESAYEVGFEYGTTDSYGSTISIVNDYVRSEDFTLTADNLAPSTTYHVRAYATNSAGTGYSSDTTFTTPSADQSDQTFSSVASGNWTSPDTWKVRNVLGSYGSGQFNSPARVAVDASGNIYVADTYNHRIQKFDSSGHYLTQFGSYGSGNGQLNYPQGITVDFSGSIYVADTDNHRIQKFDSSGHYLSQFGSYGSGNGLLYSPHDVTVDSSGNVYVSDTGNNRIEKFDSSGRYVSQFGTSGSGDGQFYNPLGITIDSSGSIYVADTYNDRIEKFDSSGHYVSQFGSYGYGDGLFNNPFGIVTDTLGNIYVSDTRNNRIEKFDSSGNYISQLGTSGSGNEQFNYAMGIAIDSSNNVYVTDFYNQRIQKFDSNFNPVPFGADCVQTNSCVAGIDYPGPTNPVVISSGTTVTTPDPSFYPVLTNYGTISGNASFSTSEGNQGTVNGTAKYTFATTTTITIPNGGSWQGTATAVVNNSGDPITDWIFNGNSYNYYATIPGNATFNDSSYNYGGTISGNATFNDASYNDGDSTITGNASFYDSTVNTGTVTGDACFALTADNAGTVNGSVTTCEASSPTLANSSTVSHTATSATFTNSITDTGHESAYEVGFEYGTTDSYGSTISIVNDYIRNEDFTLTATGLLPNTTYHVRAYASNSQGTSYSPDITFSTGSSQNFSAVANGNWESPGTWKHRNVLGSYGSRVGKLNYPYFIAIDSSSNIYVADFNNNRIQKFDPAGNFIMQTGSYGSGNGQFNGPIGIALDSSNNIYVTEYYNNRVQKFNSNGVYQFQFGSFGSGDGQFDEPYGIAIDSSNNIYVADYYNNRVQKFNSEGVYQSQFGGSGSEDGQFNGPLGIAFDSLSNIYVTDDYNNRVQKFNSEGVYQSQFGTYGSGDGQFDEPYGITIDSSDNIYVTDFYNNRVQKFNSEGVYQSQFGGSGSEDGQFSGALSVILDSLGNIYVSDIYNNRIQKFGPNFNPVAFGPDCTESHSCVAGVDYPGATDNVTVGNGHTVILPSSSTESANNLTILDGSTLEQGAGATLSINGNWNNSGSMNSSGTVNLAGVDQNVWGNTTFNNLTKQTITDASLSFRSGETIVVSNGMNLQGTKDHPLVLKKANGGGNYTYDSNIAPGTFSYPDGFDMDSSGNYYVADYNNEEVYRITPDGSIDLTISVSAPYGLAVDEAGNIFVAADSGDYMYKFSPDGRQLAVWGPDGVGGSASFNGWETTVLYHNGELYVNAYNQSTIYVFDTDGHWLRSFGNDVMTYEGGPGYSAFDNTNDTLWVPDYNGGKVDHFATDGTFLGSFEPGFYPWTIGVDASGFLYITEWQGYGIHVFDQQGNELTTVATDLHTLDSPFLFDGAGNLFIADSDGGRIQKWVHHSGDAWNISPQALATARYLTVSDSHNTSTTPITCTDCTDGGGNTGWVFVTSAPPVCTSHCGGSSSSHSSSSGSVTSYTPSSASPSPQSANTSQQIPTTKPTQSLPPITRYLTLGARNSDVQTLQKLLNALGFTVAATGPGSPGNETTYFGRATRAAVIKFQKAHGITPTGTVGPLTRKALKGLL